MPTLNPGLHPLPEPEAGLTRRQPQGIATKVYRYYVMVQWRKPPGGSRSLTIGLIGVGLLLYGPFVQAQCPDRQQLYAQLEQVSTGTSEPAKIRDLIALEQRCLRCGYRVDSVYAKVLHVLGRTYWQQGNLPLGVAYTERAIAVNRQPSGLTRRANLANSYNNLGQILADQDRYTQAQQALEQAVRIAQLYPEKRKVGATALVKFAYMLFLQGDYDKAAQRAEQGYMLAKQAGDLPLMVQSRVQQGQALIKLGDYEQAGRVLAEALPIAQQLGSAAELSNTLSMLGMLNETTGNHRAAVSYYQQAFDVNQKMGDRYGSAQALSSLGHFYKTKLVDYARALGYYQRAIQYLDDPSARAQVLGDIGSVYRYKHEYERSLSYYQKALTLFPIGFHNHQVTVNPVAEVIRMVGQKDYLLSLMQDKADTWLNYAKATASRQRLHHALQTYRVADQMIDFMRWEHTGLQSKLYWRDKTRPLYEQAIETCYRLGDGEQAFRFFEKSRAVLLADKLNELGARQQLPSSQANEEQRLRHALNQQQTQLATLTPDSVAYAPARTALLLRQDSLDTFLKQLETTNPAYFRYKYDNATPALPDLQRYLTNRQASFVTYFVGDSALYVLGITGSKATLIRQPVGNYRLAIRDFMPMLANPDALSQTPAVRHFMTVGNRLYQQLLAPLNVPLGRVIVSPDGSFVPFETLNRRAGQLDYLVNYYGFSYAYSAGLLLKKAAEKPYLTDLKSRDFLGIAPVTFAPKLAQATLPGSDLALKPIAGRFDAPVMLTHRAATRRAFLEAAPAYRFIQLFTHATADSTDPEPRLFFADSTLKLADLADGALPNAQMVVLSACQTGIGINQQGEGVFSLARGFAALGVPSMLTTLWSVEDRATYAITQLFYQYLDEGLPKDLALQRAKQAWLRTAGGASQLPNSWAGLILVGNAEPLDRGSHWPGVAAGLLALTGAGAGAWWFHRKRRTSTAATSSLRPV